MNTFFCIVCNESSVVFVFLLSLILSTDKNVFRSVFGFAR